MSKTLNIIFEEAEEKIKELEYNDRTHEVGGFLLGELLYGREGDVIGSIITNAYFDPAKRGTESEFVFSTEYKFEAYCYARNRSLDILGTIHSHGIYSAFVSSVDETFFRKSSGRDASLHIVVSPSYGNYKAVFCRRREGTQEMELEDASLIRAGGGRPMFSGPVLDIASKPLIDKRFAGVCKRFFSTDCPSPDEEIALSKRRLNKTSVRKTPAKVCIVGVGTLGTHILSFMTRNSSLDVTIIDPDRVSLPNLGTSTLFTEADVGRPKVIAAAEAVLREALYPVSITTIQTRAEALGAGFYKDFDLILSPADNRPIRHWIDRICKYWHIPHITAGTGTHKMAGHNELTYGANILYIPPDSKADLDYLWGKSYLKNLEERKSCSNAPEEVRQQGLSFSASVSAMTANLAFQCLNESIVDRSSAIIYHLNDITGDCSVDKSMCLILRYKTGDPKSELFTVFDPDKPIPSISVPRDIAHSELRERLADALDDYDNDSFQIDFERSMAFDVAYSSVNAVSAMLIEDSPETTAELFDRLPQDHVYFVTGEKEHLIEIIFEGCPEN